MSIALQPALRGLAARRPRHTLLLVLAFTALGCTPRGGSKGPLAVGSLLHLTDSLERATVASATSPASAREERSWSFAEPRPEWRTFSSSDLPRLAGVERTQLADGVRLAISAPRQQEGLMLIGGVAIALDDVVLDDWEQILVRARSSQRFGGVTLAYNLDEEGALPDDERFFIGGDDAPPIFNDGSTQVYALPLRAREGSSAPVALRDLAVFFGGPEPAALDLLSIALVPRGASFREPHGVRPLTRAGETRETLFAHTPATLRYEVALGERNRLDFGLSVAPGESVTYKVAVTEGAAPPRSLFEEQVGDAEHWSQRSVDLSELAGRTVELQLAAESEHGGAVALWAAPMLAGDERPRRPNVVFYVIDGGGADLMSVYGYNRRTTPYLERLAEEGALFEHAHTNATWTQPSTASFMTSLQHSVLGGLRRGMHSTPVPPGATTMAQYFRRGGYQTAALTSNPNCGRLLGLERGVDVMRDVETEHHSTSSLDLQEEFWRIRAEYPGGPYWVHFQTTDVHEPHQPQAPFAGLYVSAAERAQLEQWNQALWQVAAAEFGQTSMVAWYDLALERAQIDRRAFYSLRRGLYDETMAHQDHQLGRFVEELKAAGEWENTIFVVAADHGHPAGTFARFGRGEFEPKPDGWEGALFDAYATRVPLLVVWPGKIRGSRRFTEPVSMIDVLPTLLDLAGLPRPDVAQGQSLAPLLLGREMDVRPVILDEFRVDEASGEMVGNLEIIDGRWGASLEIGPLPEGADPKRGRHAVPAGGRWGVHHPYFPDAPRLLLYDLARDPFVRKAVNADHPELVDKYWRLLLEQWKAHQALAQRFLDAGGETALDPEQLQQLKALGYIQ